MTSIAILCVFFGIIHLSKPQVTAEYLYGGLRLKNASFIDYYFSCSGEGQALQVIINEEGLILFRNSQSGRVVVGIQPSFNYTAVLLSVNSIGNEIFGYDIVLIVSVVSAGSFEVECVTNLGSSTTDNNRQALSKRITEGSSSDTLLMQQVFSSGVVRPSSGSTTYGFICGVHGDAQSWTVDQNDFAFRVSLPLGETRPPPRSSTDPFTFYQLAFLCAREPYELVTVMFVTGDLNASVTCEAGIYTAELHTTDLNSPDLIDSTIDSTIDGTSPFAPLSSSSDEMVFATSFESSTSEVLLSKSNMSSQAWRIGPNLVLAGLVLSFELLLIQTY